MKTGNMVRWVLLWVILLAIILVPFFLFGKQIEAWTTTFIARSAGHQLLAGIVLASLLASDIVLPIPSSMVSTACGFLLGAFWGTVASMAGMTISCIIGYLLGRSAGRSAISQDQIETIERIGSRFGDWIIIVCRPVPVLAEASVLWLGISRVSFPRFMLLSTLSNAGISAIYAVIGSLGADANLFLPAFAASILIPLLAMRIASRSRNNG